MSNFHDEALGYLDDPDQKEYAEDEMTLRERAEVIDNVTRLAIAEKPRELLTKIVDDHEINLGVFVHELTDDQCRTALNKILQELVARENPQ